MGRIAWSDRGAGSPSDALNAVFEGAEQDPEEVAAAAEEIKEVLAELDEKEMRWLELSEFDYE